MPVSRQVTTAEADVFVDLAFGDDELVRAEFDALISACWDSPCEPPGDEAEPSARPWSERRRAR